jgi:hypothetical protein
VFLAVRGFLMGAGFLILTIVSTIGRAAVIFGISGVIFGIAGLEVSL